MWETHAFCDHCPGCRPALLDAATGQVLPEHSPLMQAVNRVWNTQTSYAERKAFIEVTLRNSRSAADLQLAAAVMAKIKRAMSSHPCVS